MFSHRVMLTNWKLAWLERYFNKTLYKLFTVHCHDLLNYKSCGLVHAQKTFNFIDAICWSFQQKTSNSWLFLHERYQNEFHDFLVAKCKHKVEICSHKFHLMVFRWDWNQIHIENAFGDIFSLLLHPNVYIHVLHFCIQYFFGEINKCMSIDF